MPHEPDPKPKIRIEVVIAAASLVLGVLAYLRPPDPSHPMHFDWLSKSVSLPLWLLGVTIVGIIALTAAVVKSHLTRKAGATQASLRANGDQCPPAAQINPPAHDFRTNRHSQPTVEPPHLQNGKGNGDEGFSIPSPDDFTVHVQKHDWEQTRGLALVISNERLTWIANYSVMITSAQSFDTRHKDYRQNANFKAVVMPRGEQIEASSLGRPIWLIRNDGKTSSLLVGDDNSATLDWPVNDSNSRHNWKLGITINANTIRTTASEATQLAPIRFSVSFFWNPVDREFSLDKIFT